MWTFFHLVLLKFSCEFRYNHKKGKTEKIWWEEGRKVHLQLFSFLSYCLKISFIFSSPFGCRSICSRWSLHRIFSGVISTAFVSIFFTFYYMKALIWFVVILWCVWISMIRFSLLIGFLHNFRTSLKTKTSKNYFKKSWQQLKDLSSLPSRAFSSSLHLIWTICVRFFSEIKKKLKNQLCDSSWWMRLIRSFACS